MCRCMIYCVSPRDTENRRDFFIVFDSVAVSTAGSSWRGLKYEARDKLMKSDMFRPCMVDADKTKDTHPIAMKEMKSALAKIEKETNGVTKRSLVSEAVENLPRWVENSREKATTFLTEPIGVIATSFANELAADDAFSLEKHSTHELLKLAKEGSAFFDAMIKASLPGRELSAARDLQGGARVHYKPPTASAYV